MDILARTLLALVAIVLVFFAIYYASSHYLPSSGVTEQQAVTQVQSFLQNNNPDSIINLTNVTPSEYPGSWHIEASVIRYPTSPCPSYYVYSFDYPKYGFVNRTESLYTANCTIYGLIPGTSYIIGSYPVAIARSYALNTSSVLMFVQTVGYDNTVVHATYYNQTYLQGANYSKVWIVNYSSPDTNKNVYSVISQTNGTFITTYNITH
jgi:hypothetical protein